MSELPEATFLMISKTIPLDDLMSGGAQSDYPDYSPSLLSPAL